MDREERVNEIIAEMSKLHKITIYEALVDENLKQIIESDVIIFFVTCFYAKTCRFKKEFEYAKATKKITVIVVMGILDEKVTREIAVNYENFRVIEFSKINSQSIELDALTQLKMIILNSLQIECLQAIESKQINLRINSTLFSQKNMYLKTKIVSNNTELFFKSEQDLKLFDMCTQKLICKIKTNCSHFCIVEHLNQIFACETDAYTEHVGVLYEKIGKIVRRIRLSSISKYSIIFSINYSPISKHTYIVYLVNRYSNTSVLELNEKLNFAQNISVNGIIKVLNSHIYSWNPGIFDVYDLSFNLRATIQIQAELIDVLDDPKQLNTVFLKTKFKEVVVFCLETYTVVSSFVHAFDLDMVFNKIMMFASNQRIGYLFYTTNFKNKKIAINEEYLCKLNSLDFHLYTNAYLLPCGNSACLDCIYKKFNFYEGYVQCNFDSCKERHQLTNKFKKNSRLDELIKTSLPDILTTLIDNGNRYSDVKGRVLDIL